MTRITIGAGRRPVVHGIGLPDAELDHRNPSALLRNLDAFVSIEPGTTTVDIVESLLPWEASASAISGTDLPGWLDATGRPAARPRPQHAVAEVRLRPVLVIRRGQRGRREVASLTYGWRGYARVDGRGDLVPLFELEAADWCRRPVVIHELAEVLDGPAAFTGRATFDALADGDVSGFETPATLHCTVLRGLLGDLIVPGRGNG